MSDQATIDLTCKSCGAILACQDLEDTQLYTLDNAGLPFIFSCPPGYACNQGDSLTLQCCNQQLSVTFPKGATQTVRTALTNSLMQQCQILQASCGGTKTTMFFNTPQTCQVLCPDGTPFTYTVQAGVIGGKSLAEANAVAYREACILARRNRVCPAVPPATGYFKFDEAGGNVNRVDSVLGLRIGNIGTASTSITGIISDGLGLPNQPGAVELIGDIFNAFGGTAWSALPYTATVGASVSFWIKYSGVSNNNNPGEIDISFQSAGGQIKGGFNIHGDPTAVNPQIIVDVFTPPFGAVVSGVNLGTVSLNTWYHVVATYNQTNGKLTVYLNGVLKSAVTIATAWTAGTNGSVVIENPEYFTTYYDELAIYNNLVLTQTQVTNLYNNGSARRPSNV